MVEKFILISTMVAFLSIGSLTILIFIGLGAIVRTDGLTRKVLWLRVQEFAFVLSFALGWAYIAKGVLTS